MGPAFWIPTAISLASTLFGGSQEPEEFGLSAGEINALIDKYREAGLEGIRTMGQRETQNASRRLAASGLEPTLALQQGLYTPILEKLAGARTNLEGRLAGVQGNLLMGAAQGQQRSDLAGFSNLTDLFAGLGDLSGLFALQGYQNYNPLPTRQDMIGDLGVIP